MTVRKTGDKSRFQLPNRLAATLFICFLTIFSASCGGEKVMEARTEEQAIKTISILKQNGIDSYKELDKESNPPKFAVFVENPMFSNDNTYSAQSLITDYCLAQEDPAQVIQTGMVQSQDIEARKVSRDIQIRILEQLNRMPGVVCPSVTVNLPKNDLVLNPIPASATVTVETIGETSITQDDLFSAARGGMPNLKLENFSGRVFPKQVHPIQRASSKTSAIVIISTAVALILGSIAAVFFLQKRRSAKSNAALPSVEAEQEEEDFLTEGEDKEGETLALTESQN